MKEIIIIKETWLASIVRDSYTFVILFLLYFLNYTYLGNSTVVVITISICFFVAICVLSSRKPLSIDEAIEKLRNM